MQGSGRTISLAPSVGSSLPSPPLLAWQFPHRTAFFGAFSATRDSLIKVGSLIAGIGLGFNILISILQMAGVYVFVLALLGALVMMAGVVIACIKFIMLFQRDAFVVVFCVFIFLGLLLSLFWTWASLISGAGLGGLLIYFYVHNITY